jgi:hypothetical protein
MQHTIDRALSCVWSRFSLLGGATFGDDFNHTSHMAVEAVAAWIEAAATNGGG